MKRTILTSEIFGHQYIAVNEIFLHCEPHLGKFSVSFVNKEEINMETPPMSSTMADGIMVSTSIGSTGWALSHGGEINLNEEALQVVFVGGVHSSANFCLPRRPVKINLRMKNSSINEDSVAAYNIARERMGLSSDPEALQTLNVLFGSRVVVDGKVIAFGVSDLEIDPSASVPFVIMQQHTVEDKARKLTTQPSMA